VKVKTKAILGLILSLLGLIIFSIILGPVSIYLGLKARKDGFKKLGMAAVIIGSIATFFGVLAFIPMGVWFSFLEAKLNTDYPLVIQASGSMEHNVAPSEVSVQPYLCSKKYDAKDNSLSFNEYWDACGEWYEKNNITKDMFSSFQFNKGINRGDILIIKGVEPKDIKVGDILLFTAGSNAAPITHRVVKIAINGDKLVFMTKGDHNEASGFIDMNIQETQILGKAINKIPKLGYLKILLTK
jgi:hypothetical protein